MTGRFDALSKALLSLSLLGIFAAVAGGRAYGKEKLPPVGPDDSTLRLFQLLDTSYAGKLDDFCLIGDVFKDPKDPGAERQEILKAEYDKTRIFGKLRIYVRIVDKLTPAQLKTYTPKQIYDYGEVDSQKFTKTDPGSFGRTGDIFFRAENGGPLASAPVTEDVQKTYDRLVTQYLLPALQKK